MKKRLIIIGLILVFMTTSAACLRLASEEDTNTEGTTVGVKIETNSSPVNGNIRSTTSVLTATQQTTTQITGTQTTQITGTQIITARTTTAQNDILIIVIKER